MSRVTASSPAFTAASARCLDEGCLYSYVLARIMFLSFRIVPSAQVRQPSHCALRLEWADKTYRIGAFECSPEQAAIRRQNAEVLIQDARKVFSSLILIHCERC